MARYSIDGQILTDMADAIRAYSGGGEGGLSEIVVASGNISGSAWNYSYFYFPVKAGITYTLYINTGGGNFSYQVAIGGSSGGGGSFKNGVANYTFTPTEDNDNYELKLLPYSSFASSPYKVYYLGTLTYTPQEMVTFIQELPPAPDIAPMTVSGDCSGMFKKNVVAEAYLKSFGYTITTINISNMSSMFEQYSGKTIPIVLNGQSNVASTSLSYMFSTARELTAVPEMHTVNPSGGMSNMFYQCYKLKDWPENFGADWSWNDFHSATASSASCNHMFESCFSLRSIPETFLKNLYRQTANNGSYSPYAYMCSCCYGLDELTDVPIAQNTQTSQMFTNIVNSTTRLKDFTFAKNADGTVPTAQWKSQTIDLTSYVGYGWSASNMTDQNSGITKDKEVKDDATYQALKDDPDWFTINVAYSRYNHDSAVNTINSLPDTSAYLAANGGTNTIQFKGAAGELTDGGAINTLTEEEIAVAAAKGWTVTLV